MSAALDKAKVYTELDILEHTVKTLRLKFAQVDRSTNEELTMEEQGGHIEPYIRERAGILEKVAREIGDPQEGYFLWRGIPERVRKLKASHEAQAQRIQQLQAELEAERELHKNTAEWRDRAEKLLSEERNKRSDSDYWKGFSEGQDSIRTALRNLINKGATV